MERAGGFTHMRHTRQDSTISEILSKANFGAPPCFISSVILVVGMCQKRMCSLRNVRRTNPLSWLCNNFRARPRSNTLHNRIRIGFRCGTPDRIILSCWCQCWSSRWSRSSAWSRRGTRTRRNIHVMFSRTVSVACCSRFTEYVSFCVNSFLSKTFSTLSSSSSKSIGFFK